MTRHNWTYQENEVCVEQAIKSFVIEREYDYEYVINKLYLDFKGAIKKSSLRMKLQNIKYLLDEYHIPNTLRISPLSNYSVYNADAFFAICRKYSQ